MKAVLFALSLGLLRRENGPVVQNAASTSTSCYVQGKAKEYRGLTENARNGASCMRWTEVPAAPRPSPDNGLGNHPYCRAPNGESEPYCYPKDAPHRRVPCRVPVCTDDTRDVQQEAADVKTYVGAHDCQCAEQLFGSTTTTADTSVAGTSGGGFGLLQQQQVKLSKLVRLTPANAHGLKLLDIQQHCNCAPMGA